MQIFGLTFILYLLKWSDGNGFWSNYRISDENSYKQAVKLQKLQKKLIRCELSIKFMTKCRDTNVFPKFTRWKNANSKAILETRQAVSYQNFPQMFNLCRFFKTIYFYWFRTIIYSITSSRTNYLFIFWMTLQCQLYLREF